jgi:CTP:molybdopterin cytidylyltransferase MocA
VSASTPRDVPFVIAAAGRGSRLGFGIPKCLVEVGGRTVLEHQLDLLAGRDDVRVVVGYRSDDVRALLARLDRRVGVIENRDWETTNTLASLDLATRDVDGRCVIIDGDLIIDPNDFDRFLEIAFEGPDACIAATPAGTEDGVFVEFARAPDAQGRAMVTEFRRSPATGYEWSGLALVQTASLRVRDGWVFSALEPGLPLRSGIVRAWEIDTVADLGRAEAALRQRVG